MGFDVDAKFHGELMRPLSSYSPKESVSLSNPAGVVADNDVALNL